MGKTGHITGTTKAPYAYAHGKSPNLFLQNICASQKDPCNSQQASQICPRSNGYPQAPRQTCGSSDIYSRNRTKFVTENKRIKQPSALVLDHPPQIAQLVHQLLHGSRMRIGLRNVWPSRIRHLKISMTLFILRFMVQWFGFSQRQC
jgi:hypothetical protein